VAQRILGVDPGTLRMGYGLLEVEGSATTCLTWGVITASRSLALGERLWRLYQGLLEVVRSGEPAAVALEESYIPRASIDGDERGGVRSAMAVGQAGAIVMLAAAAHGVPSFRYSPALVKSAVAGYGRGSKEQVQEMVRLILGLQERPQPNDAADALAVALCHLRQQHAAELVAGARQRDRRALG
jgi:crossover junction endodeoxyribonuclease RuvC